MLNYKKFEFHPMVGRPEWGTFCFGPIYLFYRGLIGQAILYLLLVIPTLGLIHFWYVFQTRSLITKKYFIEGRFTSEACSLCNR